MESASMKKQQPLMIIAGMFVVLALGYFIYDRMRPRCDTFIEQTATRLSAKLHFIQSARPTGQWINMP